MCAAPGSKTSQLLEMMHYEEQETGKPPTGMVVANDVDLKRAFMLVHQTKRIGSPALFVICHAAQHFPNMNAKKWNKFANKAGGDSSTPSKFVSGDDHPA